MIIDTAATSEQTFFVFVETPQPHEGVDQTTWNVLVITILNIDFLGRIVVLTECRLQDTGDNDCIEVYAIKYSELLVKKVMKP